MSYDPSSDFDPYIIHPREPAPTSVRTVQGFLTLLAWIAYVWLWLPVVTVLAWMLGARTSFVELYVRDYHFDHATFATVSALAVVTTVLLIGWAEYNRYKFAGHDRRSPAENVRPEEVAAAMKVPVPFLLSMMSAKSMMLVMEEDASPRKMRNLVSFSSGA